MKGPLEVRRTSKLKHRYTSTALVKESRKSSILIGRPRPHDFKFIFINPWAPRHVYFSISGHQSRLSSRERTRTMLVRGDHS
jgi:hypothetical protein